MTTLFIADLHLSEQHPQITRALFSFLDSKTKNIDALYILGDLFEVWIGDDERTPLMDEIATKLSDYSRAYNIPLFYLHGNRDFLLGKRYAKQANMQLLSTHHRIELYGKPVLLMHGDTLCLADKSYQKMRKVVRNPLVKFIFNRLPLSFRKKMGLKLRAASKAKKSSANSFIMDVTQSEVERLLQKHHCQTLIHGHTHKVATHEFEINAQPCMRIDVGDWSDKFSYLEVNEQQTKIIQQSIN